VAEIAIQPWRLLDDARAADRDDLAWAGRLARQWRLDAAAPDGVAWKSTFDERQAGTHDSRMLLEWQGRATSPLWAGTMAGDLHLLALEPSNTTGVGGEPRRWLRLVVKESWGPVALGARFESVSPGLDKLTDSKVKGETEGGEIWVEGRHGRATVRLAAGQFWDNLADYPWQPRTTKTQAGGTVGLTGPFGTALSLGYQQGLAEREPGPRPRTGLAELPQASEFQSTAATLSCSGTDWSLSLSSTYSPSVDVRDPGRETISLSHDLSASFQLRPSVTVTPAVSIGQDTYQWTGIRSHTTSASVSVSWTSILEGVDLTVWGALARNRTTDALYDATAINTAADLVWRLRQVGARRTSLAVEVGSNHYLDAVTAAAGYGEIYGMLTLRIAAF
jgi:hypothetical protein